MNVSEQELAQQVNEANAPEAAGVSTMRIL
jgi:hypothetical protein